MTGFRFSGVLALGMVAGLYGSAPAWAQPVISGTFYEENKIVPQCALSGNLTFCGLLFSETPAKVLFTRIACTLQDVPAALNLIVLRMSVLDSPSGTSRRTDNLRIDAPAVRSSGAKFYNTGAQSLDFLFAAGRYPQVVAVLDGNSTDPAFECKLTGRVQQ